MKQKSQGWIIIVIGIIVVLALIFGYYMLRVNQKNKFDELFNKPTVFSTNLGEIKLEKKLKETNSLFKKVEQPNIFHINMTDDNILYTYYETWYYSIDPMHGYVKTLELQLTKNQADKILKDIRENVINDLTARIKNEYIPINIDNENKYIKKEKLQFILQDQEIIIEAFSGTVSSIK